MKQFARLLTTAVLGATLTLGAAAPAHAAPAVSVARKHTVTIVAKSNGTATVTSAGNGIVQQKERSGTWTRTFAKQHYTYYSVSVTSWDEGASSVTCKIKVDGKVIRNKTASGDFASASCSYTAY